MPQLLNECSEEDLEKYLTDNNWCAQEKFDGQNRLLFTGKKGAQAANRKGLVIGLDNNREKDLQSFPEGYIFNGEDMGRIVYLFDLIGEKQRSLPYKRRFEALETLITDYKLPGRPFRVVYTAWDTEDKRELLKTLRDNKKEGIVFKDIRASYTPGRPASGGTQVKFKFYDTCSCVVTGVNKTKRSISLGLYDKAGVNTQLIEVGNCTVYPNQDIPKVRDVVEVKYLYAYEGGSLYQPVLIGPRTDIDLPECKISQLKYKKEEDDQS